MKKNKKMVVFGWEKKQKTKSVEALTLMEKLNSIKCKCFY